MLNIELIQIIEKLIHHQKQQKHRIRRLENIIRQSYNKIEIENQYESNEEMEEESISEKQYFQQSKNICEICGKKFSKLNDLKCHRKLDHFLKQVIKREQKKIQKDFKSNVKKYKKCRKRNSLF